MDRKNSLSARGNLKLEHLEDRTVPSIFTPAQIQQAYSFNQIRFATSSGSVIGTGAGQTIAIVDAYDDPSIMSDLETFDRRFGIADPPSITVVKQSGTVASAAWSSETALDVEWAHAMAPGARIVLGEARSDSLSDLVAEVDTVAAMPGVSVVSMSWSANEWSSEGSFDSNFTTPAGHQGVTYIASSGDAGAPPSWPASSPYVLSVGGTTLYTYSNGSYENETGWSFSGGGVSEYEAKPAYQSYVSTGSSLRTNPDVSFDASPSTGLYVYDSYDGGGWVEVGGTSAGTPQWAALVAIADQGRVLEGKTTLDGASQTLYAIYRMAQTSENTYFHDVSSGNNGYAAKAGYDDVTGNGSPVANMVIAGLVAWNGAGATGSVGPIATSLNGAKAAAHTIDLASLVAPTGGSSEFPAAHGPISTLTAWVPPSMSLVPNNGTTSILAAGPPSQNTSATATTFTIASIENSLGGDLPSIEPMPFELQFYGGGEATLETSLPTAADTEATVESTGDDN
jgi:subtilase family serine protease